jgi:hypothetical protein
MDVQAVRSHDRRRAQGQDKSTQLSCPIWKMGLTVRSYVLSTEQIPDRLAI